ncbi:hypothetical protein EMA8858_03128 [Emticicia aquatica]|uniref:Uncharacterized protein n=2 Tax=Emticicia aquatica TaxID=1681835 RepID=A0ABN8EW96_9BACT|nr:hypothetical protein EMA8858_03128 [Emticicia aquatica]
MISTMGKVPKVRPPKEVTNNSTENIKFKNSDIDAITLNLVNPKNMRQAFLFLHLEAKDTI